jgi:hypothetical protein
MELKTFQVTVTTAGTPVQLPDNLLEHAQRVRIKALIANTGFMYVGDSAANAASTKGYELDSGEWVEFDCANTNQVFVDSSVNGEKVSVMVT